LLHRQYRAILVLCYRCLEILEQKKKWGKEIQQGPGKSTSEVNIF